MKATFVLPTHVSHAEGAVAHWTTEMASNHNPRNGNLSHAFVIVLKLRQTRLLWDHVRPFLMSKDVRLCKMQRKWAHEVCSAVQQCRERPEKSASLDTSIAFYAFSANESRPTYDTISKQRPYILCTTINIAPPTADSSGPRHLTLYLLPSAVTRLDTTFMGRLIRTEHAYLRVQSLAGYVATLGGGYFMCHHWSTALQLARQQQRLARWLGNEEMVLQALLHQAYNALHAGAFHWARQLTLHVRTVVQGQLQEQQCSHHYDLVVLEKQCQAALVFGRRMRRQAWQQKQQQQQQHTTASGSFGSRTKDDLARIRLVPDRSQQHDLMKSLGRLST